MSPVSSEFASQGFVYFVCFVDRPLSPTIHETHEIHETSYMENDSGKFNRSLKGPRPKILRRVIRRNRLRKFVNVELRWLDIDS